MNLANEIEVFLQTVHQQISAFEFFSQAKNQNSYPKLAKVAQNNFGILPSPAFCEYFFLGQRYSRRNQEKTD